MSISQLKSMDFRSQNFSVPSTCGNFARNTLELYWYAHYPPVANMSMWTPVGTTQWNASKLFPLRSGHRLKLLFMSSLDSTHRYIAAQKLSAPSPVQNWQGSACNIPQSRLTTTFACRIENEPGVSHWWALRTQCVKPVSEATVYAPIPIYVSNIVRCEIKTL